MLWLNNIVKIFNKGTVDENVLFNDFSFNVNKGDFISVIGSNGSGKTTLLRCIIATMTDIKMRIQACKVHRQSSSGPENGNLRKSFHT